MTPNTREITCPDCEGCGRIGSPSDRYKCRLCGGRGELSVTTPIGEDDELWEEVWRLREQKMPEIYGADAQARVTK